MPRQTDAERRKANRIARKARSEDGWLGEETGIVAFPVHPTIANKRRIPAGILNRSDNYETNSVDSNAIATHASDNSKRAITTEAIKDNQITKRTIAANAVTGTEIATTSVADGHVSGRWSKNSQHLDTVYFNAQGKVPWADVDHPDMSTYATDAAVKERTTAEQVKTIIENKVKPGALKN